ncbi:MAG: asparagine synthase (glutamine-hydrolyzing) [Bacteroidota bacterium]|nr:asparagine synthase (glutamine-hydrolyzing) [Bacteroidota bacterium]MDP3146164.1 asparagine synthase (glutamine-hydrolyzing) [Bacteroidota bacterium]
MCGIAGYIDLNFSANEAVIRTMTDAISHRGPDGFGHKIFDNIAIGHRRLSIIDLAAGKQPMSDEKENIWITYNGELYNYLDLKNELIQFGYKFRTNSDTEVIIYAYDKWGKACLEKFRGMFAFAITDLNNKNIFIARDHFGIKPLFIYQSKNIIAFASELQQFKNLPEFENTIDINAIDQYLWMQYIPEPLTVFKQIKKLKAAHFINIDFNGKVSDQQQYWDVDFSKKQTKTKKEWLEATDAVIKDSVKAHLVSDVPFGAFLSGGIDSSLVVDYMSQTLNKPVETFSIGFEEEEYNELKYAEQVAKKFNTNHHTEIVKPDAMAILPKLVKHYGEPYGDSSCIPTYYVCELARKHVTMVLSGDGGDECFAGYNSYLNWLKYMPLNHRTGFKKSIYPLQEKLFPARYPKKDTINEWIKINCYLDNNWRSKLWKSEYKKSIAQMPEEFDTLFARTKNYSLTNKVQYMDMKTYMNFDILTKVDRASMIHSLEVRTPLIDKNVWEFAATIPEEFNVNKNSGEWRGKLLLKELMLKNFPNDFVHRKKQGFSIPLTKWFSKKGELNQLLQDKLLSQNSLLNEYFNPDAINELIISNNTNGLWLLVFLEEWLCQFKK